MNIKWLGQSCIELDTGINKVVFDPYAPMGGYGELHLKAARLYISHQHPDHNNADAVELIPWDAEDKICSVEDVQSFHDKSNGQERGENIIRIFNYDNNRIRIVHLGDLGHELSGEALKAVKNCDVLIIPVGGFFTINGKEAAQIVKAVRPRTVIPVHYRFGSVGMPMFEEVTSFTDAIQDEYAVFEVGSDTLTYTKDLAEGVYVLQYKGQ